MLCLEFQTITISQHFKMEMGKVVVHVPLVGGGYGGKAPTILEYMVVMASQAVGGQPVIIANTREQDIASSPCKLELNGCNLTFAMYQLSGNNRSNKVSFTAATMICHGLFLRWNHFFLKKQNILPVSWWYRKQANSFNV
ncbi:MAG: molybdopterin cofactor-binding domain-containing protein [Syntrophomonas sp.]